MCPGRFAGMNRHADANRDMTWPRFFLKSALNLEGCRYSVAAMRENCEHTIPLAALENGHENMMPRTKRKRFIKTVAAKKG